MPDATGKTSIDELATYLGKLPPELSTLKLSLQALVEHAGGDINTFRTSVEHWYDDHMDRVSGSYKRHVAKITLVVGAILVLLLNVNALTIGARCTATAPSRGREHRSSQSHVLSGEPEPAGFPVESSWATVGSSEGRAADRMGNRRRLRRAATACNWWDQRGIFSRHGGSAWQVVLVLIGFLSRSRRSSPVPGSGSTS